MNNKRALLIFVPIVLILTSVIDRYFFMIKRADDQLWESRGGKDYVIVGKDLLGKDDYLLKGDTLKLLSGKKAGEDFIIKYCIFDNLWIESVSTHEIAWYQETMHW